ncbi:MAG: hypothetical protein JWM86_1815 [Thermoleophilia bacterium]|nr:hypothetical protein [Thermoleophilia bacterium]
MTQQASGGGDTAQAAAAAPALDMGKISGVLEQLLVALKQLVAQIGGSGSAAPTTAAAGQAALGASLPATATATGGGAEAAPHGEHDHGPSLPATASIAKYGLGANTANEAGSSTNVSNSKGDWKRTYARPAEDRTKAAQSLQTMMQSTAPYRNIDAAKAAGYDFSKAIVEGSLVHVPNATFSKQYGGADLNHPSMLLYRKGTDGTLSLIGNVMTASKQAPDLGMGRWHTHQKAGTSGGNTDLMMHVWFLPSDLNSAFSETIPKG